VRAWRRLPALAAATGTAAAAVAVMSVALPAAHPAATHPAASHPADVHPASGPGVQLAAWTVTRQADGDIKITFREAADAAGLQRTLRADGIAAAVTFTGQLNPACRNATGMPAQWPPRSTASGVLGPSGAASPKDAYGTRDALVIDPAAVPHGDGLYISTAGTPGPADDFTLDVWLVQASPRCTGSSGS
jgi:hypothetical protein